jgi:hypothetical protein
MTAGISSSKGSDHGAYTVNILLVDDEPDFVEMLSCALVTAGTG